MNITNENNFCRVFELPAEYPSGFCFGGGRPVMMLMVDWFQPLDPQNLDEPWAEVVVKLRDFILQKRYVEQGASYLVITDFGESLLITK